jgi:ribosomal-protein-serine acetyltransferase
VSEVLPLPSPLPRTVVGERLRLELWRTEDLPEVRRLIDRSRPTLSQFLGWAVDPLTSEEEAKVHTDSEERWRAGRSASWVIRLDGAIQGMLGIHRRGGPDELEIGYWLDDEATGRGIMTDACAMVLDVAFGVEHIEIVEIVHDKDNLRSGGVPRRLGFARTAAFSTPVHARCESGVRVRWCMHRSTWRTRHRVSSVVTTT